jgi:predicted lipid-binding transport protein (Tim44 family)
MGIELEKRLRKLEKAQQAKMDSTVIDQEEMKKRDELRQLMSTPEGRRLVRKLAMESAERIRSAMQAQERAQLEAMTSPEVLERLRKQWAEEDARREALKAENLTLP